MTALANTSNLAHNEKPATAGTVTGLLVNQAWRLGCDEVTVSPHFAQPDARSKRAVSMAESLSPSAWHDRGDRSPAHDELQLRVFRDLTRRMKEADEKPEGERELRKLYGERRSPYDGRGWQRTVSAKPMRCVGVYAELPITPRDRVVAFADIGTIWEDSEGYRSLELFELKPKLLSVGAVLRQCHALEVAVEACGRRCYIIHVVTYDDDDNLAVLNELSPFSVVALPRGAGS